MIEQSVFGRSQGDFLAPYPHFPLAEIDSQIFVHHDLGVASRLGHKCSSQESFDSRLQLLWTKWLGKIVIGSDLQATDPVRFFLADGKHDDWYVGDLANAAQSLEAIHLRHHHVKYDEIRQVFFQTHDGFRSAGCFSDPVAFDLQIQAHDVSKSGLIIYHQYGHAAWIEVLMLHRYSGLRQK